MAFGPSASVTVPARAQVVEGRGKYLMPGLADMHAHLIRVGDLLLYVARGVTTVRNMWGAPVHLAWRERIARGGLVGPTIVTAGPIVDGEDPTRDGSLVVRNAEEAQEAIALHQSAGYDFVKIYSDLPLPAFEALVNAARSAGLPVAGHVPRRVGLARAALGGQRSIEHLSAFSEAIQNDDSPVLGKFDRASRARKLEFIDEAKIAPLIEQIRASGAWVCPTRVVWSVNDSPAALKQRLARPEMKYVGRFDVAIWQSELDRSPDQVAADARGNSFGDRILEALHRGHANLLVGTDTANPFVVPGYSVHEELALLVRAGLTPYEALSAATRRAAEFLGKNDLGTIAVGKRADLLLLEGNPLVDVRETERIAGVMVHGRWLGQPALAAMLATVEDFARDAKDPFADVPAPVALGQTELAATYRITWKDVAFGAERVVVGTDPAGERVIHAQSFDPHAGQRGVLHLWSGKDGRGRRLCLESDGPSGRGHAELARNASTAHVRALLLPGVPATLDVPLDGAATLSVHDFFAPRFLLLPVLAELAVGASFEVREGVLSIASAIEMPTKKLTIKRLADETTTRRFEIADGKSPPMVMSFDSSGWPVRYEQDMFGARLRFERVN